MYGQLKVSLARIYGHALRHNVSLMWAGLGVTRSWKLYAEFSSPPYQQHNVARLQHLESLGLDLSCKSVLEVGAGIGDHTLFYLHRNCRVLPVDGRAECVRMLKERLGVEAHVIDLDREPGKVQELGKFDIVHCYGLLYHLSNPQNFLVHISKAGRLLLLETCVSIREGASVQEAYEAAGVPSQALHGRACRPSREWVFENLRRNYPFVYATRTQPKHREFPLDWAALPPKPVCLTRAVFVASHSPIANAQLLDHLPMKHEPW